MKTWGGLETYLSMAAAFAVVVGVIMLSGLWNALAPIPLPADSPPSLLRLAHLFGQPLRVIVWSLCAIAVAFILFGLGVAGWLWYRFAPERLRY